MSPTQMLLFASASLLIGLSKGGLGGPLPVTLVIPLLSLVMDPKEAIPLLTPLLIFADIFALRLYWKKWDNKQLRLMFPAALIGVVTGAVTLSLISPSALKLTIGVLTTLVIIYKLASERLTSIHYESRDWHGYLAGWLSGTASTLASIGAPPFTIYMLLQKVPSVQFIGTATLYFAILNLLKIPVYLQTGIIDFEQLTTIIWALPIVPIGVFAGRRALDFIDQTTFERVMLALLVMSVVLLLGNI